MAIKVAGYLPATFATAVNLMEEEIDQLPVSPAFWRCVKSNAVLYCVIAIGALYLSSVDEFACLWPCGVVLSGWVEKTGIIRSHSVWLDNEYNPWIAACKY